jgi:hypothetical protein
MNEDFKKNVTGIFLVSYFGKQVYFSNENADYKLSDTNSKVFELITYKG